MSDAISSILKHPDFKKGEVWWQEEFSSGETILNEGESSQDVYLILQGAARVTVKVDIEDERHIKSGLGEYSTGDTFGELNLFDVSVRSASVIANTDTVVARIDGKVLSEFLDKNPALGYKVLKEYFMHHADLLRSSNDRVSKLFSWGLKKHDIKRHL